MSPTYPLTLDVRDRRVVVVGGGPVAARRARGLVEAGAAVVVVAPWACEDLADLAAGGTLRWRPREYAGSGDLDGAWLVHTATGDPDVDAAVAADAQAARLWCVRADDSRASAAWTPAVASVDGVLVAVTAGGDPRRARALRDAIHARLETGDLPLRRQRRTGKGSVALIGGGPGDPGLVTTRGRQLLADADVVVADRLGPRSLLDELGEDVEVVDVGKARGNHPVPQQEINRILVDRAQRGQRVVRLKGGDPYVLGRGGEEVQACRAEGVPVEVVPGVTSAFSVPAAAGIPVTHRGLAKQVTVVSGHEGLNWPSLAAVEGTLVVLMGVSLLGRTAERLVEHGRDPATPVAVVEDGYGPGQRTTVGTLSTIGRLAQERGVRAPAVVVVGDVVDLAG